ncbi:MAG: phospholipase D-like domain-containing protein [Candidatus Wallbacteria bacterium]|nr:phospholipase D-like domain-containing protein [Candidatus Wallbacteria bacterium]
MLFKYLLLSVFLLSITASQASAISCTFNWPPDSLSLEPSIVAFIDGAQQSLDISIYQLDNDGIVNAIVSAAKRLSAANVRLVTESKYYHSDKYTGYKTIEAAGVKIIPDDFADGTDRGQCHHKFIIRDKSAVLSGSTNFTDTCTLKNNNNIIILDTPDVVPLYQQEFDQMFVEHRFSIKKHALQGTHEFTIEGKKVEIYFAPYDKVSGKILNLLSSADHSILFCMFTFTDEDIIKVMMDKCKAGVQVYGILDRWQATSGYSAYTPFKDAGMNVKLDIHKGFLHHKFIVIDAGTDSDPTVITGSFNLTSTADSNNDENLVVVHDSELAQQYMAQVRKNFDDTTSQMVLNGVPQVSSHQSSLESSLLISKVSFKDRSGDWIELYCLDDGNSGKGMEIGNYYLESDSVLKVIPPAARIRTGEFLIVTQGDSRIDETASRNGVLRLFAQKFKLTATDEQILLRNQKGEIVDAVCWTNHDGKFPRGEDKDLQKIVNNGQWKSAAENAGVDSSKVPADYIITRDSSFLDTNTADDWIITREAAQGRTFPGASVSGETLNKILNH